jgi:hypothetical protein
MPGNPGVVIPEGVSLAVSNPAVWVGYAANPAMAANPADGNLDGAIPADADLADVNLLAEALAGGARFAVAPDAGNCSGASFLAGISLMAMVKGGWIPVGWRPVSLRMRAVARMAGKRTVGLFHLPGGSPPVF